MTEANITSFKLEYCCIRTLPGRPDDYNMMAICSNSMREDKDKVPDFGDIKKLQEFLRFSEPPGWYVDHEQWGWRAEIQGHSLVDLLSSCVDVIFWFPLSFIRSMYTVSLIPVVYRS